MKTQSTRKKNPFFSIIIPARNAEAFIHEALESVFSQTFQDFEIIVIDNESNDKTVDMIKRYQKKFKSEQFKMLYCPFGHTPGPGGVRNVGIRIAQGEVLAFLDADDLWSPTHLEYAYHALTKYPEAVVYYAKAQIFDTITRSWGDELGEGLNNNKIPFEILPLLLGDNPIPLSTGCVRRHIAEKVGMFEEYFYTAQDWWFWICSAKQGKFIFNPLIEMYYRIHAESNTGGGWNVKTLLCGPLFINIATHSGILNVHEIESFCSVIKNRTSRQLQSYLRAGKWKVIKKVLKSMTICSYYERRVWITIWTMAIKKLFIRALRSAGVRAGLIPKNKQFNYK